MRLIGQFDSPFVRRVGIALRRYGYPFTHAPLSVFRDADAIARDNPLRKVPVLVLDDGTALVESLVCLDVLDARFAGERGDDVPELLLPRSGPQRIAGLRLCGLAAGVAEKAVSLVYERLLHEAPSALWTERCQRQVLETLALLDREKQARGTPFLLGEQLSHADIAVVCAVTFIVEAHPGLLDRNGLPALDALRGRCEEMPEFVEIRQPFVVNT